MDPIVCNEFIFLKSHQAHGFSDIDTQLLQYSLYIAIDQRLDLDDEL
jgi:hypothetical protein